MPHKYRFYKNADVLETQANTASFRSIKRPYYRDDHRIFYLPDSTIDEVEGADLETFEVIYETVDDIRSGARDAHFRYYNGEKIAPR